MPVDGLVDKYSRSFIKSALAKGYDLRSICDGARISEEIFWSSGRLYGPDDLVRVSRHIKKLTGDEFYGYSKHPCKPTTITLAIELILPCRTLKEALERIFRLYREINDDVLFGLTEDANEAKLYVCLADHDIANHCLSEWLLLSWRFIASWLIGKEIPATDIYFKHERDGLNEEYRQIFNGNCWFSQAENCFVFDSKYLSYPIARNVDELNELGTRRAFDFFSRPDLELSVKTRIQTILKDLFLDRAYFYPIEAVAERFNMSVASLRRKLALEGTTYRKLKEHVRREVAAYWLSSTQIPVYEISEKCGFSDPSSFCRAMKLWTGFTPSAYREMAGKNQFESFGQ